jgi:hypothetical protein
MTPYVHNTDHEAQHICCRTFAGELEDATAAGRPNLKAPPSGPAAVRLPASVALVSCLDRAAAPHVYLPHLADRWVVCVCVCVCAYACACACVHACLCVRVCIYMCVCRLYTPALLEHIPNYPALVSSMPDVDNRPLQQSTNHTIAHTYINIYTYTQAHTQHVHTLSHIRTHARAHTHTHTHTHTCTYTGSCA